MADKTEGAKLHQEAVHAPLHHTHLELLVPVQPNASQN